MRGYSVMSDEERESILSQHKTLYNGYAVGNIPNNLTPLTVANYATDEGGITVNSTGEVSSYTNHNINESKELDEIGLEDLKKGGKYKMKDKEGGKKDVKFVDRIDYEDGGEPHFQFGDDKFSTLMGGDSVETDIELDEEYADDMDLSDIDPAYDFESGGPEEFNSDESEMDGYDIDLESIQNMFDFEDIYGSDNDTEGMMGLTDMLDDEFDGKEKMKGEKSAFNFKSDGSGADVFGESILQEQSGYEMANAIFNLKDENPEMVKMWMKTIADVNNDSEGDEYENWTTSDFLIDYAEFKSKHSDKDELEEGEMCEQCGMKEGMCECGMYEEVDEEIRESLKDEKNKITEMFNRFKNYN